MVTFVAHIIFLLDSANMHYSFKKCNVKREDSKQLASGQMCMVKGKDF